MHHPLQPTLHYFVQPTSKKLLVEINNNYTKITNKKFLKSQLNQKWHNDKQKIWPKGNQELRVVKKPPSIRSSELVKRNITKHAPTTYQ